MKSGRIDARTEFRLRTISNTLYNFQIPNFNFLDYMHMEWYILTLIRALYFRGIQTNHCWWLLHAYHMLKSFTYMKHNLTLFWKIYSPNQVQVFLTRVTFFVSDTFDSQKDLGRKILSVVDKAARTCLQNVLFVGSNSNVSAIYPVLKIYHHQCGQKLNALTSNVDSWNLLEFKHFYF